MGKVGLEWALGRYIEVRPNDRILELVTLFQIIMVTPASHTLNAGTGMTVPLVQSSVTLMFEHDGKGQVLRLEKKDEKQFVSQQTFQKKPGFNL